MSLTMRSTAQIPPPATADILASNLDWSVALGLDAFKKTAEYRDGVKVAGLTPLQRYFLGCALSWARRDREEDLRRELLSDVHSPPQWRVNGPLANVPEFYEAFGVQPGQPMWRPPGLRVKVW
jgi:putative endopeptidase